MGAIKGVQTPEALGLEPIDRAPDVDHVRTQRVRRAPVDRLLDEGIDRAREAVTRIRDCERFHSQEYSKHLFASGMQSERTNVVRANSYSHLRPEHGDHTTRPGCDQSAEVVGTSQPKVCDLSAERS